MSATPARRAAHAVVLRTLEGGAFTDRALHGEAAGLSPRDRALAKQLAFGTVQRRLTLDHVIAAHATRELDPPVRAALQLGLYQLLFLEGIADHAAIGEAVELAKPSPGHRLVNAVLRKVQREGFELPADDTPQGAAIRHSHPLWLVRLWWQWLGADEARALMAADNEPAELALRVNRLVAFDLSDVPGERRGDAIVLDGPFDALGHPGYAAGAFTPQSRGSQLVAEVLDPQPGERVLDLCAAPGGKTTDIAARMGATGRVVAVERHPQRARALQAACARMRADNVEVVCADAREYAAPPAPGGFDRVLLDAPCSGLGTLRSHPDIRWRASPAGIERLAALQDELLASARAALAPGGRLVYSVCTLSPAEERLSGAQVRRTLPHRDGTDGFYIARDGG
ncbi:MAG: transcription antitermination factor NusB [Solirubrobacteraceae bacterium]